MSMIPTLLLACERANADLIDELRRTYPPLTMVRADMQPKSTRPLDVVRVIDVLEDRPGFLRVMYGSGHSSTIHCSQIKALA